MKGRMAGLTVIVLTAAGGTLAAQELWPAPGRTASASAGRVTQVSLPTAGVAAVPVCPGPQSLVAPDGGRATDPGGPVVVGAAVQVFPTPVASAAAGRPPTLGGIVLSGGGEGVAVRTLPRTSAGLVTLQVPKGSALPATSAVQITLSRSGDARGLAALVCPTTATRTWLVGGGTRAGRRGHLVLANPAATPAAADVTVFGPKGPVRAPAGTGITVPARGVRALWIDALAPDLDALAVLVEARSGRVSATLQDTYVRGIVPAGADDVTAAAPAARRQVVPGVSISPPAGTPLPDDAGAPGAVAVRVVNPGPGEAVARLRLLGAGGSVELDGGVVTLRAGEVHDVPVTGVPAGVYSAVVEADVPVIAGAVVGRVGSGGGSATGASATGAPVAVAVGPATVPAGAGTGSGGGDRPADFGWAASVEPLSGTTLLALPELTENGARVTGGRVLAVVAPDGGASLEVVELDGDGRRLAAATASVPAGTTARFNVSPRAAAVQLRPADGSAPVAAAVLLHLADPTGPMISVLPVRPGPVGTQPRPYAVSDVRVGLR